MKKTIKALLTICSMALCLTFVLTGCEWLFKDCEHTYDNACDASCNECGEERTVTHDWNTADCDAPKTCTVCEATDGEALGHSYTATGYDDHYHYQKCSVCGHLNDESKEKHALDGEYACACGAQYTVDTFSGGMDGYSSTVISLYNSNENLVKKIEYANEELYMTTDFYYENGYLIKEEIYLADGALDYYTLYEYDENGNETKREWYLGDGTLDGATLSEYNDNGDVIKKTYTGTDGYFYIQEYEYDENGDLLKETYEDSDGYFYINEYEYDENGNVIKDTHTYADGSGYIIEYEYDEDGNCINETYTEFDKTEATDKPDGPTMSG